MSRFLDRIRELVRAGEVRISEHGEDELADDRLSARGLLAGVTDAVIVEEYIQTTRKDLVPYYYRETVRASQFTRFGVYRGGMIHQRCWLWRIGPIRREGKMTTQPGGEYMNRRKKTKYVHEGQYVAEVDVEWIEDETDWSPYLSIDDAYKRDDVREAWRDGDLRAASKYARLYERRPVAPP